VSVSPSTYVRVLAIQLVTLLLLWWFQRGFGR
jgi:hypothetical protein